MKILWQSNAPWTPSGYGNQTALTVPRLKDAGHDVAISCFFGLEGGYFDWQGITCLPTDVTRFGSVMLGDYAERLGEGDRSSVHVITLMDIWVMLPHLNNLQGLKFTCWTAFHHDPPNPGVLQFLEQTGARPIALSKFGEKKLQDAGFDPFYIPHGVPTDVFKPDHTHKRDYRVGLGIPEDAFVVGMVGANQGLPSRKAFPEVFQAFAKFQKKHSDAILYVHADVHGRNQGVNLVELSKACDIPETAMRTSNQLQLHLGVPQQLMPGVFNSFDVLAMPSHGEGFGIPLVEAQACGVPVITNNWTSMPELCGAGWLVDGDKTWDQTQHSWLKIPRVAEIQDALEQAYEHAESKQDEARKFALAYDVDHLFENNWKPVLAELEKPREIAPLKVAA